MEFREIDKSNYWDCMALTIDDSQEGFVADNKQSLVGQLVITLIVIADFVADKGEERGTGAFGSTGE